MSVHLSLEYQLTKAHVDNTMEEPVKEAQEVMADPAATHGHAGSGKAPEMAPITMVTERSTPRRREMFHLEGQVECAGRCLCTSPGLWER